MVFIQYVFPGLVVVRTVEKKIFLQALAVWGRAKTDYANKNENSKTHNRYRYIYREEFMFKKC
jgi:hypothetical protein